MDPGVVAALVALAGTLAVAAVGYRQWQLTQTQASRAATAEQLQDAREDFRARRVEALGEVWKTLSTKEAQLRVQASGGDPVGDLREVNLMLNRLAPFLLDDEQAWASTMLEAMHEIDATLAASGVPEEDWWAITGRQPAGTSVAARAAARLNEAGVRLADRYGAVVSGDHR